MNWQEDKMGMEGYVSYAECHSQLDLNNLYKLVSPFYVLTYDKLPRVELHEEFNSNPFKNCPPNSLITTYNTNSPPGILTLLSINEDSGVIFQSDNVFDLTFTELAERFVTNPEYVWNANFQYHIKSRSDFEFAIDYLFHSCFEFYNLEKIITALTPIKNMKLKDWLNSCISYIKSHGYYEIWT